MARAAHALQAARDGRGDRLPELLADEARLATFEEGRLFGGDWLRTLGMIPNEYLYYFYYASETVDAIRRAPRGAFLLEQQARFYEGNGDDPLAAWDEFLDRMNVPADERNRSSALQDPQARGPRIFFQRVPEGKVAKNRLHLDLRAAPGLKGDDRLAALEAECERLVALGATRVQRFEPEPYLSDGFIVMQDPEGNEFCLD